MVGSIKISKKVSFIKKMEKYKYKLKTKGNISIILLKVTNLSFYFKVKNV